MPVRRSSRRKSQASTYRVREVATGSVLVERLRPAHTHWSRLKGLLGTACLPSDEGLWIKPCRQVHMLGMRYPIDVAFLDDELRVLSTVTRLEPGTVSPRVPQATSVLELPAGKLTALGIASGARVSMEPDPGNHTARDMGGVRRALGNVLLAMLYLFFVVAHVGVGRRTGEWATIIPIIMQESLLAILFLTRRPSVAVSPRPLEWAVGVGGTFLTFLLRPTESAGPLVAFGLPLQICGLTLAVVAVVFLGRSIGIVPADRGIKTGGLYSVVRHPLYTAHMIAYIGYSLSYPGSRNIVIVALAVMSLHLRAIFEERLLGRDALYRDYLRRIRWRFVPYVY